MKRVENNGKGLEREKGEGDIRKGKEKEIKEKIRKRVRGMNEALFPVQIVEKDDSRDRKAGDFDL